MKGAKTLSMKLHGNDGERKECPVEVLLASTVTTRARFSWVDKAVQLCSSFSHKRDQARERAREAGGGEPPLLSIFFIHPTEMRGREKLAVMPPTL